MSTSETYNPTSQQTSNQSRHSVNYRPTYNQPELDITKEEFQRISDALKKQEFRELFMEYIDEIQDPKNRQLYENEIKQIEAERGVEVIFINPQPGFLIKTSQNGNQKCFINCATSIEVAKPTHEDVQDPVSGRRGLSWSVPLAQAPPRDDLDNKQKRCRVYDVIFHPDALHMANSNKAFHKCLVDTALDAVEREFQVQLDRVNLKFPKMKYKGVAQPTVIRRLAKNAPPESNEPHPLEDIYPARPTPESDKPKIIPVISKDNKVQEFNVPNYRIIHRHPVDMSEYTNELDAKLNVTVPMELIIEIDLPLLNTSVNCKVDVTPKTLYLLSEHGAKYRLNIVLPYLVKDEEGKAVFDTDTRQLKVTLPVVQQTIEEKRELLKNFIYLQREDSGMDTETETRKNEANSTPSLDKESSLDNLSTLTISDPEPLTLTSSNAEESDKELEIVPQNDACEEAFLKSDITYHFPSKFDYSAFQETMCWVLHVRNVQSDSIYTRQCPRNFHLRFASIGSGYFPIYYAFYIQLHNDNPGVQIINTDIETWENNIVLSVHLNKSSEPITTYLAGLHENDIKEYNVNDNMGSVGHKSRQRQKPKATILFSIEKSLDIDSDNEVDSQEKDLNISDNENSANTSKKLGKRSKRKSKMRRSLSESAYEDLKAYQEEQEQHQQKALPSPPAAEVNETENVSNEEVSVSEHLSDTVIMSKKPQPIAIPSADGSVDASVNPSMNQQRKQRSYSESRDSGLSSSANSTSCKGILKHYSRYDRSDLRSISDSCSSIEESLSDGIPNSLNFVRYSQSFSDIPEENTTVDLNLPESCKKTVRFSEVIKKQVFRLDSSILGQRKKNQKKRDRKLRALQRRLSEGDSMDYEENRKLLNDLPNTGPNTEVNKSKGNGSNNNHNKNNGGKSKNSNGKVRVRFDSESSDMDTNKNSLMFDMDM